MDFVIYEDQEEFLERSNSVIEKVVSSIDLKYKIKKFSTFNSELEKIIKDTSKNKIYILDIEVKDSISGIEVAKMIRKNDWNSIIIMVTSHTELGYEALKSQIMLLDFISKYNNWETNLTIDLENAITQINNKKILILESSGMTYRIHTDDILYVLKDSTERKCMIKTTYDEIIVTKNISDIGNLLDKRFYLSHRSCYINLTKVRSIDWRKSIITFTNGITIDYLSREKKKGLREYVRSN